MRLLMVEDNTLLAATMESLLTAQGWSVRVASNGDDAMRYFHMAEYSVVSIDWTLPPPGPSGIELCLAMRAASPKVGLLFVTGKSELGDRLLAFKAGADDYIVKPFAREEFLARVAAVGRRAMTPRTNRHVPLQTGPIGIPIGHSTGERVLSCESIVVDLATLRVTVEQQEIDLSLRQLLILIYLLRHQGTLVSESELREKVLRTVTRVQTSTVRNHIHQLRDRLGPAGTLLHSVHGRGYGIGPFSQGRRHSPLGGEKS